MASRQKLNTNLKIAEEQVSKVASPDNKRKGSTTSSVDSSSKSIASTQLEPFRFGKSRSINDSDSPRRSDSTQSLSPRSSSPRSSSPRSSSPRSSSPRSSSPRSSSSRSSSPRPISPGPRSRSSSSSTEMQPPLMPLPIPNSDTVYDSIKNKISRVKQNHTESLLFVPPKNIDTELIRKTNPNFYLFVVSGENIIIFFESHEKIKLGSIYSPNGSVQTFPNNYIYSKKNDFNSIFSFQNNSFIKDEDVTDTDDYKEINSLTPVIKNTGIIEFHVYDNSYNEVNIYSTHGNLFIYENGIASTCKIVEQIIPSQKTILPRVNNNSNEKVQFLQSNYGTTIDKAKTIDELIGKIKTTVFGTTTTLTKNQIVIHYLNAILPEDLKTVLPEKWVDVVKILYVNISCPDEEAGTKAVTKVDNYVRLHKYVNYYYKYKSENNRNNTRKIEEYMNDNTYFSPFAMHIFDFFEFLMFLKNKTTTNEVNCCIEIYNFYIANYLEGFSKLSVNNDLITQLQKKMQEKQKKIYTYLQIIKDTPETNERYKIELDTNRGMTTNEKTNEKTMKLTYKTKTVLNPKPIFNDSTYKIGPFDKIYKPKTGNEYKDILDESSFQEIIKKINLGSPMMISFHGPISSARSKMSRQVILGLCKKLVNQKYTNLEISFQEFFKKHDGNPDDDSSKLNTIQLKIEGEEFKITSTDIPEPYHSIKINNHSLEKIKQGDSLESLLIYYFDINRLTKRFPTYLDNSNSFDSPRSHVLCFLKMTGDGNETPLYIIFDDLAGNETKHDCTNEIILNKFAIFKNKNGLFYEKEFDTTGENFDFYNGGSTQSEMAKSKTLYNKLIKEACEHRAIEGDFINESLQQFRADLEYVVNVKNKDNKYYVPDIYVGQIDDVSVKTCLHDFCFGKTGCFGLKNIKDVKEPTSIILKSVYTFLKDTWKIIDSTTKFYENLEVCVFGVFNISAPISKVHSHLNEPPNYININKLKSIIYGKNEFTFNNNPLVFDTFKDALQKTTEYTKRLSALYSRFPENYVDKLIESCNNELKPDVRGGNPITKLSLAQIETFKAVFHAIDDENAKTAIGTLEFMNKISKFNTVDSICEENDQTKYAPLGP